MLENSDIYYMLGKELDKLNFEGCGQIKDTIFEYAEITWPAKVLLINNQDIIYYETNYIDKKKISRITLKTYINLSDNLGIGLPQDYFINIKDKIDTNRINEGPDGYLHLINQKYPNIWYALDLPIDSPLTFGLNSIKQIPDSTQIRAIIFLANG